MFQISYIYIYLVVICLKSLFKNEIILGKYEVDKEFIGRKSCFPRNVNLLTSLVKMSDQTYLLLQLCMVIG